MLHFSVIIDDLNLEGISVSPREAHAILIVNSNTMLAGTVTTQRFQLIPGWHFQIVERDRSVQDR